MAQSRPFSLPPGFVEEVITEGLAAPTAFAVAPDGRIYVTQKGGHVRVFRDGALQADPFLNLSGEVNRYADRGLMGIALHPTFPDPAYVYLAYAWEPGEAAGHADSGARSARVIRVTANPDNLDQALPDSTVILLGAGGTVDAMGDLDHGDQPPYSCFDAEGEPVRDCIPVDGPSHIVDDIAFGPDGALYISAGEATLQPDASVRAQDVDSLAGKILRIDGLTGEGLPDNPFWDGDPGSNRSKVFALGMRNPFRFTFEPGSGAIVIGDVGAESWEEINRATAGDNLGWPCFEGKARNLGRPPCTALRPAQVTFAWHTYPHAGDYSAAIGGDYYTGESYPEAYRGVYFFADHNRAALLTLDDAGESTEFATNVIAPVQISAGPDGDLLVLSFVTGTLSRIRYSGDGNRPPVAVASAEPPSGPLPLSVHFSSEGSVEPDGEAVRYAWDFGDGESSNEPTIDHVYGKGGNFEARLTLTDDHGTSDTALLKISAGSSAPQVTITLPDAPVADPLPGDEIALSGTASDVEDGPLSDTSLRWSGTLHHNEHVHVDYFAAQGPRATLVWDDHGENTWMEICLNAADSSGMEGRACTVVGKPDDTAGQSTEPGGVVHEVQDADANVHAGAALTSTTTLTTSLALTVSPGISPNATVTATVPGPDQVPVSDEPTSDQPSQVAALDDPHAGHDHSHAAEPTAGEPTGARQELWRNLEGSTVAHLTADSRYPAAPDETWTVSALETSGQGTYYGERLTGWLLPPTDGLYTFWIAGDDEAQLWLSADDSAANLSLVAHVPEWSNWHEYDKSPEQTSPAIELKAGQRYWFEVLHKQADQREGLSVAWQIPGGERAVIDGLHMQPAP
jgi:glucose/arabinose dehydrogenase